MTARPDVLQLLRSVVTDPSVIRCGSAAVVVRVGRPVVDAPPELRTPGRKGKGKCRWWLARAVVAGSWRYADYLELPGEPGLRDGWTPTGEALPVSFVAEVMPGGRYTLGIAGARYELTVPEDVADGWYLTVWPRTPGDADVQWHDRTGTVQTETVCYLPPEESAAVPF